jgi:transketolase
MTNIQYVPADEFTRVRGLAVSAPERVALFSQLARINTLYMITRAGSGHIGTSFSCLDLLSWLYLEELKLPATPGADGDLCFSSKGHDVPGLYSLLIGLGQLPFEQLHQLRRLGGLPGHPDVGTPGLVTNTGSLGMGISKAKGFLKANRLAGKRGRVFVLTGDGELQEGQFWESLVSAANQGLGDLTAIIDHNKIQSDTWLRRVSDLGDLEAKLRSFGWHVVRADGHDLGKFPALFRELSTIGDRPKVVVADTVKGKGVSFMEQFGPDEKLYQFHSGAPDQATYEKALGELLSAANARLQAAGAPPLKLETQERPVAVPPTRPQRLINAYAAALVDQAKRNPRVVALDADLVKDCGLVPFSEQFPERFIECGIAEQDMVSQAGALALRGQLPIVHSFACFLSPRPNEQIYNNATERTKVIYVGSLTGLLPSGPGHSHQCVRDIAALSAMPDMILVEPGSEAQVAQVLDFCINTAPRSCYLRLVSFPYDAPEDYALPPRLELGVGHTIVEGTDAVAIGYGPVLLGELYKAAQLLRSRFGVSLRVVNLPWLNQVDRRWLREVVTGVDHLFALDNHYVVGGQGDMLLRELMEMGVSGLHARRIGVSSIPFCGQPAEVLRAHRLDADSLVQTIATDLGKA